MHLTAGKHTTTIVLTLYLMSASLLLAFEQSSYFIIDLVEAEKPKAIEGRIAIPAALFSDLKSSSQSQAPNQAERSEFEIDFTQSIRATSKPSASFQYEAKNSHTKQSDTRFDTESFDLGTKHSPFSE